MLYELKELCNGAIIVCPICGGTGSSITIDYFHMTVGPAQCSNCNGLGRVVLRHEKIHIGS